MTFQRQRAAPGPVSFVHGRLGQGTFLLPLLAMVPTVKQQETVMKKVISIFAVATALLGSASFALAQSNPSLNDVTGTDANRAANAHDGEYFGHKY